ncbi:MAG: hypothetical protein P4L56_03980 [Candidatus Sulfopaludibacter sp.]|nr:hypothetical protein [Candidatus Sulfopaludibacter sp.]
MAQYLSNFVREEDGQDLIEYTLLMTFIAIACLALVGSGRNAINQIWITSNSDLTTASTISAS